MSCKILNISTRGVKSMVIHLWEFVALSFMNRFYHGLDRSYRGDTDHLCDFFQNDWQDFV